jgi:hypothetical protein
LPLSGVVEELESNLWAKLLFLLRRERQDVLLTSFSWDYQVLTKIPPRSDQGISLFSSSGKKMTGAKLSVTLAVIFVAMPPSSLLQGTPGGQLLEKQSASGPKTPLHIPGAVRFRAGKPEFSFFDTQLQEVRYPEQGDPDLSNFPEAGISEFEKHFRFDPCQGPRPPSCIGFL